MTMKLFLKTLTNITYIGALHFFSETVHFIVHKNGAEKISAPLIFIIQAWWGQQHMCPLQF